MIGFTVRLLSFWLLSCLIATVAAQSFMDIQGKVFDSEGYALGNAALTLDSGEYRSVSRADGKFTIERIPSGMV